jgi:fibronectin-binding autotransporter adhesin
MAKKILFCLLIIFIISVKAQYIPVAYWQGKTLYYNWDAITGNSALNDGTGNWNSASTNFTTDRGVTNAILPQNANVTFGGGSSGTAGSINVTGAWSLAGLTFLPPSSGTYSLTGTGTLSFLTNALITNNTNARISTVINGSGPLSKFGTGTLFLTAANLYSGSTSVYQGTLDVGGNTATGSVGTGAVSVGTNGTLAVTRTGAYSLSAATPNASGVSGTGAVSITNTGTLTLDRAINLTGSVSNFSLSGGPGVASRALILPTTTLTANNISIMQSGDLLINSSADINLGVLGGTSNLSFSSTGGTYAVGGLNNLTSLNTFGNVTLTGTYTGNCTICGAFGLGGTLKNAGGLLKLVADASGSLGRVGFENGWTSIYGGTLKTMGNIEINGKAGSTFAANYLDISLIGVTTAETTTLTLNGQRYGVNICSRNGNITETTGQMNLNVIASASGGTINNVGGVPGSINITGTLQLTSAGSIALTIAMRATGGITVSNQTASTISGVVSGAQALTKNGSGSLTLSGANTYSGGTVINAGTLTCGSSTCFGSAALTCGAGCTLSSPCTIVKNGFTPTNSFPTSTGSCVVTP